MPDKFELNDSTPAAPLGRLNIVWQSDAAGNVSGHIPEPSAGGAVASVFGRTGAVVATSGDYTAAQVTNAVSVTGSYADPAWITSLDWGKVSGAPNFQTPWTSHIDGAGFELRNTGNVGIGVAAPVTTVHIRSGVDRNIQIGPMESFGSGVVGITGANDANNAAIPLAFDASKILLMNGNVGIGTSSPSRPLVIERNESVALTTQLLLSNPTGGAYTAGLAFQAAAELSPSYAPKAGIVLEREFSNGVGSLKFFNRASPDTSGFQAADERMRITSGGNVGIGTTAPEASLHASRGDSGYQLKFQSTGSGPRTYGFAVTGDGGFTIDDVTAATARIKMLSNGNVGINKSNPISRLAVGGLPTSSSGLTSGDIWYDAAAGNVLKIVP